LLFAGWRDGRVQALYTMERNPMTKRKQIDGVLFIDANQYLDLYRTGTGKKLLAPLKEQEDHIFVTARVADEVERRKVEVAVAFLDAEFKKLELRNFSVPNHLFGTTGVGMQARLGEIRRAVQAASEELMNLAHDLLGQISRSEDEVSKALAGIFAKATMHTPDELLRAKERKEMGNAPGKKADPLGDQVSWEQILSECKNKSRLWLVTRDGDFATPYGGKSFLNAALYQDLARLRPGQKVAEVFCYDNIPDAIRHFATTLDVPADDLPTEAETQEIKKEQEALPPLRLVSATDTVSIVLGAEPGSYRITPGTGILRLDYNV
jgi:hypothetical protein